MLALDRVPDRLRLAADMGATPVDAGDVDQALAQVRDATDGRGVDCAMEAVGSQSTLGLAFRALRPGGASGAACSMCRSPVPARELGLARAAGVLSSVGLHTDTEFKAFSPWEGYQKARSAQASRLSTAVEAGRVMALLPAEHHLPQRPLPGAMLHGGYPGQAGAEGLGRPLPRPGSGQPQGVHQGRGGCAARI